MLRFENRRISPSPLVSYGVFSSACIVLQFSLAYIILRREGQNRVV